MATLRVTGKYYIIIFCKNDRRPRTKSLVFKKSDYTKREVKEIKHQLETKFKTGEYDPWRGGFSIERERPPLSLAEAVEEYIQYKLENDWSGRTAESYPPILRHFYNSLPGMKADKLTASDINGYANRPGLRHESRKSYARMLKTLAKYLAEQGHSELVAKDIRSATGGQTETFNYLSPSDQKLIETYIVKKVRADIRKGFQRYNQNALWLIDFMRWQRCLLSELNFLLG